MSQGREEMLTPSCQLSDEKEPNAIETTTNTCFLKRYKTL